MNEIRGVIHDGVVVLRDGVLPEGTEVSIVPLSNPAPEGLVDQPPSIWQKLADLGRAAELEPCDLPADLSANHDHYLHGQSKRE